MISEDERTSIPWPVWMLRAIASDDESAYEDLLWSVGGSPPYGGVSYDEAEAIYYLVENYYGPGMAKPSLYAKVKKFTSKDPYRQAVIELFQCNDQIVSDPENYTEEMATRGLVLSEAINCEGMKAKFLSLKAGLAYRTGNLQNAVKLTYEALNIFLQLADQDPVYALRVAQNAQNLIGFTAQSGDEEGATKLQKKLAPLLEGFDLNQ